MEWRRGKTTEAGGFRNPLIGAWPRMWRCQRASVRLLPISAVMLALLPALFGLVRPETAAAQVVTTTVEIPSAHGDPWSDGDGNSGGAVCASAVLTSGSCSSWPWSQRVDRASWIWKATGTNQPAEHVTYSKTFSVPSDAYDISATVYITADNAYELSFNGAFVGSDGSMELSMEETEPFSWRSVESYSIAPIAGANTLQVTVANHRALDSGYNPAGLLYRIDVTYSQGTADTTAPVLSVPANIAINATSPDGTFVQYTASATDDVNGAVTPVCGPVSGTLFPIGTTTVICTATDTALNSSSASFEVTVVGASGQLSNLTTLVQSYNLHQGISNSLDSKLSNAQKALEAANAGDLESACGLMGAFINEVEAQSGQKLTVAQADDLIAAAQQIAAVLRC